MNARTARQGIALISVLLLLTAMLVMTLTMQLLALLGALTTRNQLAYAQAEAELHSLLTHSLLTLEQQVVPGGELPVSASLPAAVSYTRQSPQLARLVISSGTGQLALEVLVQLEGSRLRVIRHG